MTLLHAEFFFGLAGGFMLLVGGHVAVDTTHPRRLGTALFWGVLGLAFLLGKRVPPEAIGALVLVLVGLASTKQVGVGRGRSEAEAVAEQGRRAAHAERLGNGLLVPTVIIPLVVIAGGLLLPLGRTERFAWVEPKQVAPVALGLACVLGLVVAWRVTRAPAAVPVTEGSRLLQALGWSIVLPQMLAALGGIFAKAGVGTVIAGAVSTLLPTQLPLVAVVAYCAGMAAFTMVMGNAFAAFPVVTLGIGLPFIVQQHGGNPAIMGAFGMMSGYCGTLVTPMAANFNLVPTLLLELEDKHAVIKAQAPFAAAMWVFNVVGMAVCVYRF